MEKKLPKVFVNKIEKKLNNNEKIYISNRNTKQEQKIIKPSKTINKKINEIMNSKKYTYKVPVKIKLDNGEVNTNIIGKNNNNIITIDNELIKIDDIRDIELQEKNE